MNAAKNSLADMMVRMSELTQSLLAMKAFTPAGSTAMMGNRKDTET